MPNAGPKRKKAGDYAFLRNRDFLSQTQGNAHQSPNINQIANNCKIFMQSIAYLTTILHICPVILLLKERYDLNLKFKYAL